MNKALTLNEADNVATAITPLSQDEVVVVTVGKERVELKVRDPIPFGHKFAINDIADGGFVVKYGHNIGAATSVIKTGQHVHVHNLKTLRGVDS
jgi:altronate dehydratase small subunit